MTSYTIYQYEILTFRNTNQNEEFL